ncbi:hypothetical protein [[Pseudomonas] boreopolis]|uniref:hypothetical protein n=1 Tax=Xanthomonas boreopolis TaxID=86183 RepID=UPI003D4948E2
MTWMNSSRRSWRRRITENLIAVAAVLLLHLLLASVLFMEVDPIVRPEAIETSRLSIRFITQIPPEVQVADPTTSVSSPVKPRPSTSASRPSVARRFTEATIDTSPDKAATSVPGEASIADDSEHSPSTLNLRLPSAYVAEIGIRSSGLQDSRQPVDVKSTRFNKSWAPDGGAMQQSWAFHSKAAKLLLSATGALEKPCSAEERRRREKRCFGAQYEGAEGELETGK